MTLSAQIIQLLLTGLTIGSIYAMVAIGFNIIYNSTDVLNFAQGEFVVLGGLSAIMFHHAMGLNLFVSIIMAVLLVSLIGILFERSTLHLLKKPALVTLILITIAVSIILRGTAMLIWGKDSLALEPFSTSEPILILGAAIHSQLLWVIGIMAVVVLALTYLFGFTLVGKALRACAINRESAKLMGINTEAMVTLSFAMSAAIGAIVGGVGNSSGALAAGIMIGVIESFCAGFISSGYKDAFAFGLMLLVLFLKPGGLLGKYEVD